jgi:hypothetical protein
MRLPTLTPLQAGVILLFTIAAAILAAHFLAP